MSTTIERPTELARADVSGANVESSGGVMSRAWRGQKANKALLFAGILAVALYGLGDLISGLLYAEYSWRDQAISELAAFGSPVRPLMVTVIVIHGLLLVAFGVGVWRSADRTSIRWIGGLLIADGLVGFPTHTVFAMSSRWMETGFNDTMHIMLTGVFSLLLVGAITLSAVAYRGWFRLFSIGTTLVLIGFGLAASVAIAPLEENVPTPWAGGFERINAYAYFAWLIALAVILLRTRSDAKRNESEALTLKRIEIPKGGGNGTRQPVRSR